MNRRIKPFEFEAAQIHRDEAVAYLGEIFPKLSGVQLGIVRDSNSVGVRAQVEHTTPYARPTIIDALVQLGVSAAMAAEQL